MMNVTLPALIWRVITFGIHPQKHNVEEQDCISNPDMTFEVHKKLSHSNHDISEFIFIELKREARKNLLICCISRHHTPISSFMNSFLNNSLEIISKQSNKICVLMGDFNVDLLK